MAGQTISTSETKIESLKLQSSAYGVTIPLVFGVTRIAGNLVDYLGFTAIPRTTTQGGKGGGVKTQNTTYTYQADVIMGLCHGPITDVPRIWRGKKLYTGGYEPTSIATASEGFTAASSGPMTYTVAHAAALLSIVSVFGLVEGGVNEGGSPMYYAAPLAAGTEYTVSGGTVTVLAESQRGQALTVNYTYATSTRPTTAMDKLGLSWKAGTIGQSVWSVLPAGRDVPYSGLAWVAGQGYDLGSGAQVDNHLFEVIAPLAYHLGSSVPDVDPALALTAALTQLQGGAGFPAALLATWNDWSDYCVAHDLLVSPAIDSQVSAAEVVRRMAELTNTAPVYVDGRLDMVPLGDTTATAHGRTYTPDITPVYDLDDEAYITNGDTAPVRPSLKSPADRKNHIRVEFLDRGASGDRQYNPSIAESKDQADIDANGLRSAEVMQAHWICRPDVAQRVAQTLLQRSLYVCAEYRFDLPEHYSLISPGDLVTLTDATLGMDHVPVRVTVMDEGEDGLLAITAEDYPAGTASAAAYPTQFATGYQADYNAAPGAIAAPAIFEAPAARTTTGLEVYLAVRGAGSNWGGCRVWVSLDGANYQAQSVITGGSRYGQLSGAIASGLLPVTTSGALTSGSAADSANLVTLCYVGGASPEYLAYETAALTGAGAYTLGGLTRAAYGTTASAHTAGDLFVRCDDGIGKSGALDVGLIGQTIYFKFTSFNVFGGAEQSLADVTAYPYTITGAQAALLPAIGGRGLSINASGITFRYPNSGSVSPSSITLQAVRSGTLAGIVNWSVITGTATLSASTGNTVTLAAANMATDLVTIAAVITTSVGTYTATVSITKVRDGAPSITLVMSPQVIILPAAADGTVTSYAAGTCAIALFSGATDDTSNWTLSRTNSTGVTSTLSGSTLTVSGFSAANDTGYVDITASRSGYSSITQRLALAKSTSASSVAPTAGITLAASAPSFTFDYLNAPDPSSQSITITAALFGGASGTVDFQAFIYTKYVDSYINTGLATLTGTGLTRSLAVSAFGGADHVVVRATLGSYTASITIVRQRVGVTGTVRFVVEPDTLNLVADSTSNTVTDLSTARANLRVLVDTTDVTSGWTFTITSAAYVTAVLQGSSVVIQAVVPGTVNASVNLMAKSPSGTSFLFQTLNIAVTGGAANPVTLVASGNAFSFDAAGAASPAAAQQTLYFQARALAVQYNSNYFSWQTSRYRANGTLIDAFTDLYNNTANWSLACPSSVAGSDVAYYVVTVFYAGYNATAFISVVRNGVGPQAIVIQPSQLLFSADAAGNVTSYASGSAALTVMSGGQDETALWTLAKADSTGVTSSLTGRTLAITDFAASADNGYVDITATRSGYGNLTKRLPLGKARAGGGTSSIYASMPGALSALIGNLRWYPRSNVTLNAVRVDQGTPPVAAAAVFNLRKNGAPIFSASKPTVAVGANSSTPLSISVPMTPADYLTVDVEQAQGSDAVMRIDYF